MGSADEHVIGLGRRATGRDGRFRCRRELHDSSRLRQRRAVLESHKRGFRQRRVEVGRDAAKRPLRPVQSHRCDRASRRHDHISYRNLFVVHLRGSGSGIPSPPHGLPQYRKSRKGNATGNLEECLWLFAHGKL